MTPVRMLVARAAIALPLVCTVAGANQRPSLPELFVFVTPDKAHVQQQIVLRLRLQSPDPFDALRIEIGEVRNAESIELQTPGTRRFEAWGTRGHVWETARAVIPTASGALALPLVRVRGRVLRADGTTVDFDRTTPERTLAVLPPEAALNDQPWLVASDVELTEHWDRPPDQVHSGEIVQRTVTVFARGVSGDRLPDLVMRQGPGISVLSGDGQRRTEVTPDGLIGHLIQNFTIRVDTESVTEIAPVELVYWDAQSQGPRRAAVTAWRIEPLAPDAGERAAALVRAAAASQTRARITIAAVLMMALLLGALAVRSGLRRMRAQDNAIGAGGGLADRLLGRRTGLPSLHVQVRAPEARRGADTAPGN